MTVLLTVLGALLPFAVAGMLVTAPVVLWLRRRRAPGADPVSAAAAPAAGLVPAAAAAAGSAGATQAPTQPPAAS